MILEASKLIGFRILSLRSGGVISTIESIIVDPNDLKILGFFLNKNTVSFDSGVILEVRSIREFSHLGMIIDSDEELLNVGDVVKIDEMVKLNFQPINFKIKTQNKTNVGTVIDYTVDVNNFYIQQLIVKRPILKSFIDPELIINRSEILEINDEAIIVKDELAKQGYVEGKNIEIDLQNAQGEQRNLKTISQQLAESSDVVLAIATPSAQSLANTTQTTPVIFSAVTDPVSAKLVESREHPGGNVTGTSDQSSDAISTQINLIKKVLPKAKTIGILYTQSEPNSVVQKDEAKRLLEEKGFTVVEKTILDSNNVKAAAESLMAEVDMVFVPTDNIISSTMETVKQVSIKHKVPVFGGSTEMIAVGGLYNYGTNYEELGRQTARMLVRVLKGEKPENIAVELPEKLELHTNQEMADALGI